MKTGRTNPATRGRWRCALPLLALSALATALSACATLSLASSFDEPTRSRVYDQYWAHLEREYPFFDLAGIDPDRHREAYRARVVGARDRIGYLHALAGMLGELHDPHVKINIENSWYRAVGRPVARPRIGTMYIDRELYLVSWPASVRLVPKVRPGATFGYPRVVSIEGYGADFSNLGTLLLGEAGTDAELVLEWWDGSRETVGVPRDRLVFNPASPASRIGSAQASPEFSPRVSVSRDVVPRRAVESVEADGVSWVWLRTLSPETAQASRERLDAAIHAELDEAMGSRAIVLDLTRNGGGDPRILRSVLTRFVREGALVWIGEGPSGVSFRSVLSSEDRKGRTMYSREVVVVTDRYTASAAEHLASVLQREQRARVVGARTVGAEAMVRPIRLEEGLSIEIGFYRLTDASGRGIQQVGVVPDVEVDVSLDEMERLGATRARREAREARIRGALELVGAADAYGAFTDKLGAIGYPDLR